ncbi:MAG: hypothetical protein NWF11_07425 [Candidatus Bathyarchaeota archaeon]|nr:hypothetical protein [Candidatus Bathyarchaeota archaeon]
MGKKGSNGESSFTGRKLLLRVLKALLKTVIVYFLFETLSAFLVPFDVFQSYQTVSVLFVALYIFFIFATELTRGTVFHHVFAIANSLVFLLYFTHVLSTSVFHITVEQIMIMVDLRFFLGIFVLGSILGFAKSMLDFLMWINKREEIWLSYQMKSL